MSGRERDLRATTRRSARRGPTCCASSGRTSSRWSRRSATSNVRVEGYEADDVIASLAEQAKRAGHRRDDRDRRPRRLPADRRRACAVMTTCARDHRHASLRPRGRDRALRHPAGADPRLHRAEGRHLGQHPGRPGHRRQDRRPAAPASTATLEEVLAHVDEISGAKRKQNLREHADHARISKELATRMRDIDVEHRRRASVAARSPTARGCARCSARSSCATRCAGSRRRSARRRRRRARARRRRGDRGRRRAEASTLGATWRRCAGRRPAALGGARASDGASRCGSPRTRAATRCWSGEAETLAGAAAGLGRPAARRARLEDDRRASATEPATSAPAARARHDGRRLPDRPGAAAATRSTSCSSSEGIGAVVEGADGAGRATRSSTRALAERQRERDRASSG